MGAIGLKEADDSLARTWIVSREASGDGWTSACEIGTGPGVGLTDEEGGEVRGWSWFVVESGMRETLEIEGVPDMGRSKEEEMGQGWVEGEEERPDRETTVAVV